MKNVSKLAAGAGIVALAALFVITATPATAAPQQELRAEKPVAGGGPISISVIDPSDRRTLAEIEGSGGSLTLEQGESVSLHLYQRADGKRYWLPGTFRLASGGAAVTVQANGSRPGEVLVTAHRLTSAPVVVTFAVEETRDDDFMGKLSVAVVERRSGDLTTPIAPAIDADRLADHLYRGILLRAPDAAGGESVERMIAQGGWQGVVQAVRTLADSRESQIDVYTRGTCNQQRLLAMYEQLLGVDSKAVDLAEWKGHLERLERGEVSEVALALVQQPQFASRYGFQERTALRRGVLRRSGD